MLPNCDEHPQNSFCYCTNMEGESVPQYKQHNSSGNNIGTGYACCHTLHVQPAGVASANPHNKKFENVYDYINTINPEDSVCDYSKYYGKEEDSDSSMYIKDNYPELYNYAEINKDIFNNYYTIEAYRNYGIYNYLKDNTDLVPIITENNIEHSKKLLKR